VAALAQSNCVIVRHLETEIELINFLGMKNLGFSESLQIALCKGSVQNLANVLQRETECSKKCEGLKSVSCIAVKRCAHSTSTTSVVDGTVKHALAAC